MKWSYAWRELKMHPGMMLLLFIQTVIVYIVAICVISSVVSRRDSFKEIEPLISGNGQMMNIAYLNKEDNKYLIQKKEDAMHALPSAKVYGCYNWGYAISGDDQDVTLTGYDDELWKCYTPELCAGRWFDDSDKESKELEVVIAQRNGAQGRYHVGDILEEKGDSSANNDIHEMKLKVIGIVENGAAILGSWRELSSKEDYRSLFWDYYDYYEDQMYIWGIQSDLYRFKMNHEKNLFVKMGGLCFFQWTTSDSKIISQNQEYIMEKGITLDSRKFQNIRENSNVYIYEQIRMILPILVTLCIMTILSTACNMAIMVKKSMRHYAIYYINGLDWKACLRIHERCIVMLEFGTLFVAALGLLIARLLGITKNTVISFGFYQIFGCFLFSLIFSLVGIWVARSETRRFSVKDILREGGNL